MLERDSVSRERIRKVWCVRRRSRSHRILLRLRRVARNGGRQRWRAHVGDGITRTLRGTCGKRRRCARRRRGNPFRTDPSRRRGTRRRPFPGARAFSRSRARTEIEPTHAASSRPSICGTSDDYTSGTGSTQLRHASRLAKRSSVKSLRCLPMSLFCSRF